MEVLLYLRYNLIYLFFEDDLSLVLTNKTVKLDYSTAGTIEAESRL